MANLTTKFSTKKLNLGCGHDYHDGWLNIDIDPGVHPDLIHDLYQPLPFDDSAFEEVLAQDVLEHFTPEDGQRLLTEIARVLQLNGRVTIRVPNVDQIIEQFTHDQEVRNLFLYDDSSQGGIYGIHKVGYTPQTMVATALSAGLLVQTIEKETTNFVFTFTKKSIKPVRHIAFINQTLGIGGAETLLTDLLAEVQQHHHIKVSAHVTHPRFQKMLQAEGILTERIHVIIDIIGDWKGLLKAVFLFPYALLTYGRIVWRERHSDLIFLSGFPEKIIVSWFAKLIGVPVVWLEHAPLDGVFRKFFYFPKVFYFLGKNLPDKVIATSHWTRQYLLQKARISQTKIHKVWNGRKIDMKKYSLIKEAAAPTVVCVSRLEPGKGQDLLIRAFAKVIDEVPNAQLRIVGEGDFIIELKKLVKELRLSKSVQFTGWVADSLQEMAATWVVAFPSQWELEGFGMVSIEAMALGKPVVAFEHAANQEIIANAKTGTLVHKSATQIDDFAQALTDLLQSPRKRKRYGAAAQQRFQQFFSIEKMAEQYVTVFQTAAHQHAAKQLVKKILPW